MGIHGVAVCLGTDVYIVRGDAVRGIRQDINSDICISLISIKEYIRYFGLSREDNLFCSLTSALYLLAPIK